MRVVTPRRLKDFALKRSLSKIPLLNCYGIVKKAQWETFHDVKEDFNSVDYVGNNRYVFNIKGNDFRTVVIIIFCFKEGLHQIYWHS